MLDIVSKPIVDRNVRRNDNGHNGHDSLSHQVRLVTPPLYHHGPSQCPPQPHGPQRLEREGASADQDPQPGSGQHLLRQSHQRGPRQEHLHRPPRVSCNTQLCRLLLDLGSTQDICTIKTRLESL